MGKLSSVQFHPACGANDGNLSTDIGGHKYATNNHSDNGSNYRSTRDVVNDSTNTVVPNNESSLPILLSGTSSPLHAPPAALVCLSDSLPSKRLEETACRQNYLLPLAESRHLAGARQNLHISRNVFTSGQLHLPSLT
ncbi:unnamed protein product [Protopolystoma xenopodis]|uniref:Uncharacterized protein n=1 Tax=Protopolystoma xenopodis TaxID=117903 RepID=A0A448WUY6_9PLAT|nr:unnamed protein product [Protopolystoma xenopodis]